MVEAYWLARTPPTLAYYHYQYNAATNPHLISPQLGWSGPTTIGAGFAPRMADGAAGLFLLSEDVLKGTEPCESREDCRGAYTASASLTTVTHLHRELVTQNIS